PVLLQCRSGGSTPLISEDGAACQPNRLLLLLRANSLWLSGPLMPLSCSAAANRTAVRALAAECWAAGGANAHLLCLSVSSDCLLEDGGRFRCRAWRLSPELSAAPSSLEPAAPKEGRPCLRRNPPVPPARDYGPEPGSEAARVNSSYSLSNVAGWHSDRTESTRATKEAESPNSQSKALRMEIAEGYQPWSEQGGI
uniref:Ig-like domain-containing protein n=1 Tax=Macrostomum lignano TaxID=282301 RepID=A0A1I8HE17_9PLAT